MTHTIEAARAGADDGTRPASAGPALPRRHRGSCFADASAAREAVRMALPMIERACTDTSVCGAGFLSIVVLDPGLVAGDVPFEQAILYEHALGERAQWDADYAAFARAKARVSWEHGCDAQRVQSTLPHALHAGDTLLWGGVWLDGIVVGVSGAFPWYDEAFALAVAANLRALAKRRHAEAVDLGRTEAR